MNCDHDKNDTSANNRKFLEQKGQRNENCYRIQQIILAMFNHQIHTYLHHIHKVPVMQRTTCETRILRVTGKRRFSLSCVRALVHMAP